MNRLGQLEETMRSLESQRSFLGDAATDAALTALRQEMAALKPSELTTTRDDAPTMGGERKIVTVMFADISGFTALSEKHDPETVRDWMNGCFARLVPVVGKYGGTVDKFIGDEIMALFGAPVSHENDPERALLAALEMIEALDAFNAEHNLGLGMHFGINTGTVIAGGVGSDRRQDYSVMGDAVNLASRLEDKSERGEILVGPDTYRNTERLFTFETLQPVRVKGKAEPIQVYRLTGCKPTAVQKATSARRRLDSEIVGRDAELAALYKCVSGVVAGKGGIATVIGEPGLGKSRLLAELHNRSGEDGILSSINWLEGRTLSFGQAISYRPFQEILWHLAEVSDGFRADNAWRNLEDRIRQLFGHASDEILPYVASLMSLEIPVAHQDRVRYLDGEAMRRQIFLATRRLFETLAKAKPTVLVFEDLHWADESSVTLLEHLVPLVAHVPLLIVGVTRPDHDCPGARIREIATAQYGDWHTEVRIEPLTKQYSAKLVQNLIEAETLSPEIQEAILAKAEGNPFFLEEIIRSLMDAGKLVPAPYTGRWRTANLDAVSIPDTVQGVIMARVDRLDEDLRGVLKTASVIGRSFFYQILRSIQEADRQFDKHLSDLHELEFITQKDGQWDLAYMFKHVITQQVAYESILVKVRKEMHGRVAQALETLFADRIDEVYSLLASHYARAEVWGKAHGYLLLAGDHAGRVAADTEALSNYRQALTAYQKAFGDIWEPLERTSLHRKIGEALYRQGEHTQALECLHEALEFLGKPFPRARWAVRLVTVREILRQIGHRLMCRFFCSSPGSPATRELEEELRILEVMGWIYVFFDYEQFFLVALKALNVSERRGYSYGVARGLVALGTIWDLSGFFRLARKYHTQARKMAELLDNPAADALARIGITVHAVCTARWDDAEDAATKAGESYHSIGDIRGLGYAKYMIAVAKAYKGELAEALQKSVELVRLGEDGGDSQVRAWGLATEGFILRLMGRPDMAAATLKEASGLAEVIQDHVVSIWSNAELGRVYVRKKELDAALYYLDVSRRHFELNSQIKLIWVQFWNALTEGYLFGLESAHDGTRADWAGKVKAAARKGQANAKVFNGLLPEALKLEATTSWLLGNSRKARKLWTRSLELAQANGQRYDAASTRLEMAVRLDDKILVHAAQASLDELRGTPGLKNP